jgi:hypothetical protein
MPNKVLKKGDIVHWRDGWGSGALSKVKVTSLDVTKGPNEKYGEPVQEVEWKMVQENRVVIGLDSLSGGMSKWAYSYQVAPEGQDPKLFHNDPLYREGWY